MKKLCLLLALLLVFSLCGCDSGLSSDKEDPSETAPALTAEGALEEALDALTGGGSGRAVILGADGQPAVPANTGIALLLSSHVTFDVKEFSAEADTAVAKVEITAPDTAALLRKAMESGDWADPDALSAQVEALLKDGPATVEYTVDVRLVLVGENWCVVPDFALSNALTGGLTQTYMELQQELLSQLQEGGEG